MASFLAGCGTTLLLCLGLAYCFMVHWGTRVKPTDKAPVKVAEPQSEPQSNVIPLPVRRTPSQLEAVNDHYEPQAIGHSSVTIVQTFQARCSCGWTSQKWNGTQGKGMVQFDYIQHKAQFGDHA